jgi:PqqD family protein of HPr-rel-A system
VALLEQTNYRINPALILHWACWDDEYVIFDECSGQTHQIDPSRAFVLNTLCDGIKSFGALHADLAAIPSLASNTQLPVLLKTILDEFGTHGLVEAIHE